MLFIFSKASESPTSEELGPVAAIRKVQRFGTYRDQTRTLSELAHTELLQMPSKSIKCKGKYGKMTPPTVMVRFNHVKIYVK